MAATAKQLANLKKARAARKRNLAAKNKGRLQVKAKSVKKATKRKAPAKRKAPRKKNPAKRNGFLMRLVSGTDKTLAYWTGSAWDTTKANAAFYSSIATIKTATKKACDARNKLKVAKYRDGGIGALPVKK